MVTEEKLTARELDAAVAEKVMRLPLECRLIGDGKIEPLQLDFPNAIWRIRTENDATSLRRCPSRTADSFQARSRVLRRKPHALRFSG